LEQLGIDSLGLVDLALALEEKAGRPVADGDLRLNMTVADVRSFLTQPVDSDQLARGVTSSAAPPLWPYGPGRAFRVLGLPFELIYRYGARSTTVLGGDRLRNLGPRVIVAGTHHGFADIHLIQHGLRATPARRLSKRLVIAASAANLADVGAAAWLGILAFGTYPLNQHGERDASLRGLATLMQRGNAVLIFPQGTHADPEQERAGDPLVRFRPGVAHLAEALEAEVVPFGIAGTERLMPSHVERFNGLVLAGVPVSIKPGPLVISFGPPLRVQDGESPRDFTQRLQDVCYRLTRDAEVELSRRLA
jgi:1-acyl-sn-glycerol-3-phosphate acyltransferase